MQESSHKRTYRQHLVMQACSINVPWMDRYCRLLSSCQKLRSMHGSNLMCLQRHRTKRPAHLPVDHELQIAAYVKFALLRQLAPGRRLGVSWYLHPDEGHNNDGNHIDYLRQPDHWRSFDPELFDALGHVVSTKRSIETLMQAGVVDGLSFAESILSASEPHDRRCRWRSDWFERARHALADADLVFADPDNGLVDDAPERRVDKSFSKRIPLAEALAWAKGRTDVAP